MNRKIMVIGVVLLVIGFGLASYVYSSSTTLLTSSFGSSSGEYHFSTPFEVPSGVTISVTWDANQVVLTGITTAAEVARYNQSGGTLTVLKYASGTHAGWEYTTTSEDNYSFFVKVEPFLFGTLTLGLEITVSYRPYSNIGLLLLLVGIGITIYGVVSKPKQPTVPIPPPMPPTVTRAFCIHCGREIQPNLKFCPYCGKKQEETS